MKRLIIGALMLTTTSFTDTKRTGIASYYHDKFEGRKTATGDIFRQSGMTAASNYFKLNSYVIVSDPCTGKSITVKINDRMGHKSRLIDLTKTAATRLGILSLGISKVTVQPVDST